MNINVFLCRFSHPPISRISIVTLILLIGYQGALIYSPAFGQENKVLTRR
jgi:hypothetical protein